MASPRQDGAGPTLHRTTSSLEHFAFGFGTMVGVGWLVLIDDWLGRGGPGGAMVIQVVPWTSCWMSSAP